MSIPSNRKIKLVKLIGQLTGVASIVLAAVSLLLTRYEVRTSYRIDAQKTSQQLFMSWYDLKQTQGGQSIREPMQTELTAFKTLFLAESIFLVMKASDQQANWGGTIDFMIKDATGIAMDDKVIDDTYDPEFATRVKQIFKEGKNNYGEITRKFPPRKRPVP